MPEWLYTKYAFSDAWNQLIAFFINLKDGYIGSDYPLVYRDEQYFYSEAIIRAFSDNKILLLEAGVGTGKSIGYLLPIIYSMKKLIYKKVIISTSSIALQRQLKKDVDTVSKLLNYDVDVSILKGNGNYACYQEITSAIERSSSEEKQAALKSIRDYITGLPSWDYDDLKPDRINPYWDDISLKSKQPCEECDLAKNNICPFLKEQNNIGKKAKPEIIITNHSKLSAILRQNNSSLIDNAGAIIIDEAHALVSQMRLAGEGHMNPAELERTLNNKTIELIYRELGQDKARPIVAKYRLINSKTVTPMTQLQTSIRSSARIGFNSNSKNMGVSMKSVDKLNIDITDTSISKSADDLAEAIEEIIHLFQTEKMVSSPSLKVLHDYLVLCCQTLRDIGKGQNSTNIYWVNYDEDNPFDLYFHEKSVKKQLDKIYEKPVILTSGTLSTAKASKNPYARTIEKLGLKNNPRLREEDPLATPYSFKDCLLYYDPNLPSPTTDDRSKYIIALARKIVELIKATEGKALILFTCKRDMQEVYNIVKLAGLEEELILQNDNNTNECVERFKNNVNSCLFATGAFWEGIDIKGVALSNLIITKLPYPADDPDIHEERKNLTREQDNELIEAEMIMRLKQGFGRGKRDENDRVLFSILDPRFKKKREILEKTLPESLPYTTSLNEVKSYAQEFILQSKKINSPN